MLKTGATQMDQANETQVVTAGQAVVATLVEQKLPTLFALPGVQNDHFFDALHGALDRIRVIHTRHEQGAGYMALGAAMVTGEPSGCCVVPGPGVLNAGAALCTGYAVGAPVLCITGEIPLATIGRDFGMLHEIPDQIGLMRHLTKWSARIEAPEQAAPLAAEAFAQLRGGRPRPVSLSCPLDVWPKRSRAVSVAPTVAAQPGIDDDAIAAAARLIGGAARPAIFVGGGAFGALAEIRELAERLGAPVIANRMGRGVLDSRHPLSVTADIGHQLWPGTDVAIGIGTRMQTPLMMWGQDDALKLVHVDIDPEEMGRIRRPDIGLLGDAAPLLRALLAALPQYDAASRAHRADEIAAARAACASRNAQLAPQLAWLAAIRAELPEDGVLIDEVTQLGHVARIAFPVYGPRTFLTPGFQGTLGWGVATGIGAQAARMDTPMVVISGDGGFMFTMPELATAAQYGIPIVVVLMNDNAYGNVRRIQIEEFGNRTLCSDLRNPDFLKLADAFGIAGHRVRSPEELRPVLRAALARRQPAIIEAPVGDMPSPWGILRFKKVRGL